MLAESLQADQPPHCFSRRPAEAFLKTCGPVVYNKLLRRRTAHGLGDQQHLENNQLFVRKGLCRGDAHRMNLHPEDVFLLLIDLSQNTKGLYGLMSVG